MTTRLPIGVAGIVAIASLLLPAVATADPASDAKDLFSQGRERRAQGDCASAAPLFRKASELYPAGLGSLRNLAECEEQLGHFASSRRAWLDLKRALITEDAKKYEGWTQDADAAAARLEPKLARLTIDVNAVGPDGGTVDTKPIEVTLDGEPLATALLDTALERDPGRHVTRAGGARVHDPQQKAIDLVAGDSKRVALRVVVTPEHPDPNDVVPAAAPAGTSASTPTDASHDAPASRRSSRRTLGWVAIGTGGVLLAGAAVSLAVRQSAIADVNGQCPNDTGCRPSLQSTASRGQTASVLFDVLGPLGLVGVGAGVALILTAPNDDATAIVVRPGLGGASVAWSF
jgi:hypothetical protein